MLHLILETAQYLPRRKDSSTITEAQLRWIETCLYTRPRKTLGLKTPLDVFDDSINSGADQSLIHRALDFNLTNEFIIVIIKLQPAPHIQLLAVSVGV